MTNPLLPHPVPVQVSGTGNAGVTVLLTNSTTAKTLTLTTDSQGRCVFDLANLEGGYTVGDNILLSVIRDHSSMEYFVATNGDNTLPTWVQVQNNTKYYFKPNTARIKIDTTTYPDSYGTITITLEAT